MRTLWLNWAFQRVTTIKKKTYEIKSYEEEEVT